MIILFKDVLVAGKLVIMSKNVVFQYLPLEDLLMMREVEMEGTMREGTMREVVDKILVILEGEMEGGEEKGGDVEVVVEVEVVVGEVVKV